jgi:hypothetical protein
MKKMIIRVFDGKDRFRLSFITRDYIYVCWVWLAFAEWYWSAPIIKMGSIYQRYF